MSLTMGQVRRCRRCAGAPATRLAVSAAALALLLVVSPAKAQEFYAGKTLELLVGAPPGGGYDIYARVVGRHLARHIPGNPNVVVKNMPGAGSARAAQFIQTMAPKDGTTIAGIMPGAIMGPLLDAKSKPMFDPTKIKYLGTANSGTRICVTVKPSKISTFADALKIKAKWGGSAPNDSTYEYGFMHKHTSGTAYDMVVGYRGTTDMSLAMERGEVDGLCGWDWSSFKAQKSDWLRDGRANILLQAGINPHPELTKMGVPRVFEFVKNEDDRKAVELVVSQQVFQRSYVAPPDTPPAQLAALRAAFDRTMADPEFLADAKKMRVEIEPLPGSEVEKLIQSLYASPSAIVERARRVIRP